MGSDIALSASLRQNLLSLQNTSRLLDETTLRLNTGRKVNSALDDPLNFFTSQSLTDRAGDLGRLLDGIGQSISAIEQANNGVSALEQLVTQAQSIIQQARDEVADGQVQAEVIGERDVSNIEDLIGQGDGFTTNSIISFTLTDPENPSIPLFDGLDGGDFASGNTTLQAIGQIDFGGNGAGGADFASATVSIEELVTAINDINDQLRAEGVIANEDVIEASISTEGNLEIRSLNGGDLEINFFADASSGTTADAPGTGTNNTSANILAAQDIGFGNLVATLPDGSTVGNDDVVVTALGQPSLLSANLFADTGGGNARVAQASDQLGTLFVRESVAAADRLFDNGGTTTFDAGDTITISVNGTTNAVANVDLGDTPPPTIQDLIDGINNTSGLSDQIEASFDTDTGQISIRAISPDVETVDISIQDAGAAGPLTSRLGFGARQAVTADATGAAATSQFDERLNLANAATRLAELENDFDSLRSQIDRLVADSDFRGTNLLLGDTLLTIFNEDRTSFLETEGQILNAAGLGLIEANFSRVSTIEDFEERGRDALAQVRGFGSTLANDLGVIEARENFTEVTITTLSTASDKLVLADQNEEGAKLLALQTRQQLGLTSLSLSSQAQQGILQLF